MSEYSAGDTLENRLHVELSKCDFWVREVAFLGQIISEHSISLDPEKVPVIQEWERP